MGTTGFGTALCFLRNRRTLSARELGKLSGVDHAYIYRLENGEKTNPSQELIYKLLKVLKPSDREGSVVKWLADHPDTSSSLVSYVLEDDSVEFEVFTMAAGARHRGTKRPEPAVLIERVRRALYMEDDD